MILSYSHYEKYNVDAFSDRLPHFPDLEGYNMDAFKKTTYNLNFCNKC